MAPHSIQQPAALNQPYTEPDPAAYSQFQKDIYTGFSAPILSTKFSEWEAQARSKLPRSNFNYVYGSASSGRTNAANVAAFDRYRLKPSMLRDCTVRDTSVEIFGTKYPSPLMVAPIGVQGIMHKDGEEATARAAAEMGVNFIMSTAATRSIEQLAKANGPDGERWYQLYWPRPQYEDVTASILARAKTAGFKVLVVTLDTFNLAWRPEDLDSAYLPFLKGQGCQVGFSDPVWLKRFEQEQAQDSRTAAEKFGELWDILKRSPSAWGRAQILANVRNLPKTKAWLDVLNSGTYRKWEHLPILRKLWDGPIVLKGIQTVEDAHRAIEHGMDGIVVSNHGGRQCDGAIASLDALAAIGSDEQVKKSGLTVLFDSGIRNGSDVLKALALGAKAVFLGRPVMYGLANKGQQGVKHVLQCMLADMDNMLGNMGKKNIKELSRHDLQFVERAKL
jgi:lactate 2-monooxygenase